ncbi:hypothetical protein KR059_012201, partial [Drosophila kikkawai]
QLPAGKGLCVLCAVAAERACQRCGDFYCSKDCQLQDWQRHRYICFPLPALVHPKSFSVHLSESTEELSLEGACIMDKPDKVVVENGCPSPMPRIIPDLEGNGAIPKVAGAPVTSASIPHPVNGIVSNNNTFKASNKRVPPPKAIVPRSKSLIIISGFRSPNRCHIRDASEAADKAFAQMREKVNAMGKQMPRVVDVRPHAYCLALYNGTFHRASVMTKTSNNTARILLFDQGIVKIQRLSDMREISEELLSLPSFSVQVQLKDVPNYAFTDDVTKFLSQFEGGKFLVLYTKAPGAINVELLDPETKTSLNTRIREFCMDKKVFESPFTNNKNKVDKEPPKQQNPNAGPALNKPNPIESPVSNNKNNIEAGKGSNTLIQDTKMIDTQEKLNEKKDIAKPQNDDCAKESGESTEAAKPTSKIESLPQEPKTDVTSLDNDKNVRAPFPLSKTKDETVRDFLTRCLVARPTVPGSNSTEEAEAPVKIKEPQEVQIPHSQPKSQENGTAGAVLVPPFKMLRLTVSSGEGIDVYVVDVSKIARGIFGAFDCSFASEFSTLHSRLAEITDTEPYRPASKEFVLARFKGSWYRARVEQVKVTAQQTEYRVMYLDYTNAATLTEYDIRRYPLDFTTPCTTNICMIEGFPHKPSLKQVAYLSETVKVHQLLHVDAVMYIADIAVIKSRSLVEKLMSL